MSLRIQCASTTETPRWPGSKASVHGGVDIGQGEQTWVVLADPEGNAFRVLRPLTPEELAG